MPPKSAKGGGGKSKPKEEEREDTLQAVVLADSFEKRFAPFTSEKPRCLLPLANTPLIEYTLEFLAHAGVEEIFIYCGAHTDQLEEYIENSKWKQPSSPFNSVTLQRSSATSIGDAMRDLDARDLITGDFLLVTGDVVSNIPIEPALTAHRTRRQKDKNAIMTMVLREAGHEHRTKAKSSRPIFYIDPNQDRCLHYEEIGRGRGGKHHMDLDLEILNDHPEMDVRGDLIDCYIDICTPEVLSLWSDNFDYQSMRTSFLFGVLKDFELNGKTIHTYIEDRGYAARVRSLRAYDAITKDIIGRWTYPLTPDCNFVEGQTYTLGKRKTYIEKGVVLARGSSVKDRSIVGSRTSIGDGSIITGSVLGRRCQIGKNVKIIDSHIWDDVVVENNTTITKAVIASESAIASSCTITPGTLISFGVQIPASTTTDERSIHTRPEPKSDQPSSDDWDSDSSTSSTPSAHLLGLSPTPSFVSVDSISTLHSDSTPDIDALSIGSAASADLLDPTLDHAAPTALQRDFVREASASVYEGMSAGEDADKIRLELVAQRLASDAADAAVRDALVEAFMRRVWALVEGTTATTPASGTSAESGTGADDEVKPEGSGAGSTTPAAPTAEKISPGKAAKEVFAATAYGSLLRQMGVFDRDQAHKPDQVAVLSRIEASCVGRDKGEQVLLFAVTEAHQAGVVQEEGIFEWWDMAVVVPGSKGEEEGGGAKGGVRKLTEKLVEVLRAESESESEEDDDEDDDEEEDETEEDETEEDEDETEDDD